MSKSIHFPSACVSSLCVVYHPSKDADADRVLGSVLPIPSSAGVEYSFFTGKIKSDGYKIGSTILIDHREYLSGNDYSANSH